MAEDTTLLEKRVELKRQLASGKSETLAKMILDGPGRLIRRFTRKQEPASVWYNGIIIALFILLIGCLISLFLGESPTPEMILLSIWGVGLGVLVNGRIIMTGSKRLEIQP